MIDRRTHLAAILAAAGMLAAPQRLWAKGTEMEEVVPEYGVIGEMLAQPGRRAELAAIARGRPLIAGFGQRIAFRSVGGAGRAG